MPVSSSCVVLEISDSVHHPNNYLPFKSTCRCNWARWFVQAADVLLPNHALRAQCEHFRQNYSHVRIPSGGDGSGGGSRWQ